MYRHFTFNAVCVEYRSGIVKKELNYPFEKETNSWSETTITYLTMRGLRLRIFAQAKNRVGCV